MEYCGSHSQQLKFKSIFLMKRNFIECPNDFKTQREPFAGNATLGHPAGNRTCYLANIVRCSTNWATEAVAESMPTSSVFIMVAMLTNWFGLKIIQKGILRMKGVECKCHNISIEYALPFIGITTIRNTELNMTDEWSSSDQNDFWAPDGNRWDALTIELPRLRGRAMVQVRHMCAT